MDDHKEFIEQLFEFAEANFAAFKRFCATKGIDPDTIDDDFDKLSDNLYS